MQGGPTFLSGDICRRAGSAKRAAGAMGSGARSHKNVTRAGPFEAGCCFPGIYFAAGIFFFAPRDPAFAPGAKALLNLVRQSGVPERPRDWQTGGDDGA